MNAIKDLFASERGFFALILVIAATVLTGMSQMTIDQWQSFSLMIFGIYAGGKTITGAIGILKGTTSEPPVADAAVAPVKPEAPALATPAA